MKIPGLRVKQWLEEWEGIKFTKDTPRRKPEPEFYLFTMKAYDLKRLAGIFRRDPTKQPSNDIGVQRRHIPDRSKEILKYLQDGFPLSRIDRKKLVDQNEVSTLRMPGWLPTSIVVNILTPECKLGSKKLTVANADLVKITSESVPTVQIEIPDGCFKKDWDPKVYPIEVIDGQHRLWALEEAQVSLLEPDLKKRLGDIEVPVVAFHGLDRTWAAYLFYTINQLPKRIDTSLVFDLYPLLRTEEWLLRFEGPNVYRESRAQDLTIILWGHPESPWKDRILRLGGREKGSVTQASFIRSLLASFIKRYTASSRAVGGLFGSPRGTHETELGWCREQQAAFLILIWQTVQLAVKKSKAEWAKQLRARAGKDEDEFAPFSGPDSLLSSDQGCRCVQAIMNDIFWLAYDRGKIELNKYSWERPGGCDENQAVAGALSTLKKTCPDVTKFAWLIAEGLAGFDWRMSSAIDRSKEKQDVYDRQASYRGSAGYRAIRENALRLLQESKDKELAGLAGEVLSMLENEGEEE